jgi:membrane protein YqaA with SNARE-associated domain
MSSPDKSNEPLSPMEKEIVEQKPHIVRRLYEWTLHWAHTPYGVPALFLLAFAESSVFPIPPDVLLIALSLSRREKALKFAAVCSIGSVLGGMAGYGIGYGVWEIVRPYFIPYVFSQATFDKVGQLYEAGAFWYIFIAAFTPIPYKVFTIAAGVYHQFIPLWVLLVGSVVGRSARFFLVAGLLYFFGPTVRKFVESYFDRLLWAFLVLGILGFVAMKFL